MVEIEEKMYINNVLLNKEKFFIVAGIPAFNEEQSIAHMVINAQKFADLIIVCDDGSSDMTAIIAERLGATVIKHGQNLGYGAAIKSLFEHALNFGADVLVTLDGDGQHDASEIPNIIEPIKDGAADIVIGSRFIDVKGTAEMPFYRKVGAKVITKMVNGSAKSYVSDSQSGFRAYNREALSRLSLSEEGMSASVQILLEASKMDLKIREVPSTCKYENNLVSTSTENPVTHGFGVISSIIKLVAEEKPLTALGIPGILSLIAGIFFGVWMLQIYALTHSIVTNIALASLAFVFTGFFMLSTAITLYAIRRLSVKMALKK